MKSYDVTILQLNQPLWQYFWQGLTQSKHIQFLNCSFFLFFKFRPKNRESICHPNPFKEHNKPAMSFHFKLIYLWHWSFQAKGENHVEVVHH